MNEHFEIGEVAIFWRPDSPNHGKELTVTSLPKEIIGINAFDGAIQKAICCTVEFGSEWVHGPFYTPEMRQWVQYDTLRKRRPPQDLGSWDDCVWKPKHMQKLLTFSPKKQVPA